MSGTGFSAVQGDLDLTDLNDGAYFKLGVANAEQGVPKQAAYTAFQAYHDGYAFGLAMSPYLFARRDGQRDIYLTYEIVLNRYLTYQEIASKFTYDALLLPH